MPNKFCKRLFAVIIFMYLSIFVQAQRDSLKIKQSFQVNLNDLLINRILVTYAHALTNYNYLEIACGYRQSDVKEVHLQSIFSSKDFYLQYNVFNFRAGIKHQFSNNHCISVAAAFNHWQQNHVWYILYKKDDTYPSNSVDLLISRNKFQIGTIVKISLLLKAKKLPLLIEPYYGIGLFYSRKFEIVHEVKYHYGKIVNGPINRKENKILPSFHLGIAFGIFK